MSEKLKYHVENRYADQKGDRGRFAWFWKVSYFIDSLGEARGIDIQPPHLRGKGDARQYARASLIWLGACGSLSSMTGFFIGPLLFQLSFRDSLSAGISGAFLGSLIAGFGALIGPRSGLRQMVGTRFQFGWWPAKFIALLNVLTLLGWSVISLVFGGQLLAAISNEKLPLEVGIVIMMVVSVLVAMFGINYVTIFDKCFVVPALIAFLLVYVCTGSQYAVSSHSVGESKDIIAHWVSFFGSSIGITSTWIALTSDYYVDFPVNTNPVKLYLFATSFVFFPTVFIGIAGMGIASAAAYTNEEWNAAYENLGTGGLLATAMSKWHGGGKFIVVLMFISLVTNNILNTYSIPLSSQVFGRIWTRIPRYLLSLITGIIYLILALVGRNKLADILSSFLPMIAYWSTIYGTIMIIETWVIRRDRKNNEYDWESWNTPKHFPNMYAAVLAFCCGAAGSIVGMYQTYYVGPIAKLIGSEGGDIGALLGIGFSAVTYLPLRLIEVKIRGKPIKP